MNLFEGRKVWIASKHQKENVIAPVLESILNVACHVKQIDTDTLGTFSGEVERELSPIACARKKCEIASEQNEEDLFLASEGSFGPDPQLFFSYCNEELLVLIDKKNDAEWHATHRSTATNFNAKSCTSLDEVLAFCNEVGFPEHAIILRKDRSENDEIFKGIQNEDFLKEIVSMLLDKYNSLYIETDMRALFNPTRMKNIEIVAQKLCDQLLNVCPSCNFPGFSIHKFIPGLPCSYCGLPTKSIKTGIFSCQKCAFTEELLNDSRILEDPMYCDFCNP
jgi:hypothetical protein